MAMQLFRRRKRLKLFATLSLLLTCLFCYTMNLHIYFLQRNYFTEFSYPELDMENADKVTREMRFRPETAFQLQYELLLNAPNTCSWAPGTKNVMEIHLLYVIKSAVVNSKNRDAIRSTWASPQHRKYSIRHVFLLALPETPQSYSRSELLKEQAQFGDLIQGNFVDRYHNNTFKTIMGLRWINVYCHRAKFIMFVDDDFYISTKNLIRFVTNPDTYPSKEGTSEANNNSLDRSIPQLLYTGFLFFVLPVRFPFHRFSITLEEYPYNIFPPFINAGAFLITNTTALSFCYAALYTNPVKMDDVYVGILAKRVGIEPTHNRYFFPYKVPYSASMYKDLIASHGYKDPEELMKVYVQNIPYEHND